MRIHPLGTVFAAAAALFAAMPASAQHATMGNAPAHGSQEMQQSMMGGMRHMQVMPLTGDVDKDFIRMMRQHHLQGIAMARIQLQKGDDPQAKQMAQNIIDEQQKEIRRFDDWLQRNPASR